MSSVQSNKSTNIWIHCNRCFENYIQKQRILFLLSCYDVICEKCIIKENQTHYKCPLCGKVGGSYSIGNNLPTKVKELFHPKLWTLNFPSAWSAVKFQTKQRDHFLMGCQKMFDYNRKLEKERDLVKEECRQMYVLQQKTKKQRKHLEGVMKRFMEKKKKANRSLDLSRHREREFKAPRPLRTGENRIHLTYHHAQRNDDTFDFPPDNPVSKSFLL